MQINGLQHLQAAQSLSGASRASAARPSSAAPQASAAMPADELDLSPEAQAISGSQSTQASGDIRWEKVNALRQAIADGNYDSTERVSAALDKFLDAYA